MVPFDQPEAALVSACVVYRHAFLTNGSIGSLHSLDRRRSVDSQFPEHCHLDYIYTAAVYDHETS